MSEDIRKMIDKVKNFKQFVNENNEITQTYTMYNGVSRKVWETVWKDKNLKDRETNLTTELDFAMDYSYDFETGNYDDLVVEIGNICFATDTEGNCTDLSPLYAVDILWTGEPLESFSTKEVFPNPVGVHTFSGDDSLYLDRFCSFNPESPYCETL